MSSFTIFHDLRYFAAIVLLAVGALLPIVGPLSGAPIFLAMTSDLAPEQRDRMSHYWQRGLVIYGQSMRLSLPIKA
jgi:hypothetical protein